jgi:hypothetical protein
LITQLKIRSTLQDRVPKAQWKDVKVGKIRDKVKSRVETSYQILDDDMIVIERWMYLLNDETLKKGNFTRSSWVEACNTLWEYKDISRFKRIILVDEYEKWVGWIHGKVWDLSTGKYGTLETNWVVTTTTNTWVEVEKHHNGLCIGFT